MKTSVKMENVIIISLTPGFSLGIGDRRILQIVKNSRAKFCLFPNRALPFHINPPFILQYSPTTPILNEKPVTLTL